ncbi:MAG: hypothetical protein BGO43_00150 [Gammaproteobacteria bacterium 39-13]|nr:HAD family phosphatase [Gammaproteobacteria bacterium]OJV96676.1 MAG: hypothetical protein BGO43_00150 [Gammaproteobacteria bacterium 39-13]
MTQFLKGLICIIFTFAFSKAIAYQAIIFDCDGVLVDTEGLKFTAWKQVLSKVGINFEESEYIPLVGYSSAYIAQKIQEKKNIEFDQQEVINEKEIIYHQLQSRGVPLFEDGIDFLKQVISQKNIYHFKVAIASSASQQEILENLKQIGVNARDFDLIISGHDDLRHIIDSEGVNKPKPYIYQICATLLQVLPQDCLVFEDSNAGVIAATDANMNVIAVPNRFTQNQDFSQAIQVTTFKQINFKTIIQLDA